MCLEDLINMMASLSRLKESYTYKDPITEFVECLYVNFDFDSAQKKLRECESVRKASWASSFSFSSLTVCFCHRAQA